MRVGPKAIDAGPRKKKHRQWQSPSIAGSHSPPERCRAHALDQEPDRVAVVLQSLLRRRDCCQHLLLCVHQAGPDAHDAVAEPEAEALGLRLRELGDDAVFQAKAEGPLLAEELGDLNDQLVSGMPTMRRLFLAVVLARCPVQQRAHAISDGRDAVVGEVRDDVHGVLHAVAHSAHETPLREVAGGAVDAAVPGIHDGAHTAAEQIDGILCRLCPSALRIFGEPQSVRHEAHAPQRRAAHELGGIRDRAASFGDETVVLIVLIVLLRHQHELRGRRRCLGLLPLRWRRAAQHCCLYTLVRRHLGGLLEALLGDLVLESGHHLLAELQQI
mmetsp:Transcript_88353/g.224920  ORF Transcript_88353/g.224920 Transcript_88353/m.224920 type:complete len:329 (-) Transcript_88353:394-1380(-)